MAEAVASGAAAAAPGVFSRKASGLVRVGSTLDVFIFNVGLVSVGIAIAYNQYYGPSLYPGAQPWISTLLAAAGMLFVAAAFYCWSVVFPRSGGVYVFLSRTINPGVAFDGCLREAILCKARMQQTYGRIRISLARFPHGVHHLCGSNPIRRTVRTIPAETVSRRERPDVSGANLQGDEGGARTDHARNDDENDQRCALWSHLGCAMVGSEAPP